MNSAMEIHYSSNSVNWETPQELFNNLDDIFSFDIDAAATKENSKCSLWYGPGSLIAEDALSTEWNGTLFLNPPYGRGLGKWIDKAYKSSIENDATVVCLLPARTETKWFQTCWKSSFICFIKGRIRFEENGQPRFSAPFPNCIVVFGRNLPNDLDISLLSGEGTVVQTLWQHNPIDKIRYEWMRDCKDRIREFEDEQSTD